GHTTMARFEYGTVENNLNQVTPEVPIESGEGGSEDAFNQSVGALRPNTKYYYRVAVSNYEAATNSGWEYGSEERLEGTKSFTTPPAPPPGVALSPATGVAETTATLNGTVTPNGFATTWKFEYGESTGYGASTAEGEVGSGGGATPQAVSSALSGLKPDTVYHFRLVATNPGGTTQSGDGTFRTAAGSPPVIGAYAFVGLSPWEVVLDFTVDPKGYQTTFAVQWGTTTAYGNTDSGGPTNAVFGPQGYDWDAGYALAPGTTYHLRVSATNRWGTTTGPDLTVRTPSLTPLLLVDEFGIAPENSTVPVDPGNPTLVLGRRFTCPPACTVEAEVEAVGKHGKKIKLGKAKFTVPKDGRKHKLEVRLPKRAKRLLAMHHRLHLRVRYRIAGAKHNSSTIVSSLTLTGSSRHASKHRGRRH
ncbi:MAG: fibronectin type III domain-containing protein, partial [Acidobacteriota bacterium]|nr:fibronectin type III domain-containing protein [Acidobacteriota bacterium]